ncbi:MAG: hypothetical protein DRQ44_13600 [Gammaproteobacteria bacterium]|nr:MAG: hypothetical protein DRQ44_13600 [Gammaproteobacteria bacterium]
MPFNFNRPQDKTQDNACFNRRRFLQLGIGASTALFLPNAFAGLSSPAVAQSTVAQSSIAQAERKLSLLNLHTGEHLHATYWAEGQYQTSELKAINHILRDHRTGDAYQMDNDLLDLLHTLHQKMDSKQEFQIISGYRSPKTNAALNKKSSGVAKKSLHMQGKAIDIRLPGCQLADLQKAAINCQTGGVGYYPKSNFIHIDTGRVRRWG